jgi:hypothetical protein
MSDHIHTSGCVHRVGDTALLKVQAEQQLKLAFEWINKHNLIAANAFLGAAEALLTISEVANSELSLNFQFARASLAHEEQNFDVAIRHAQQALAIAEHLSPPNLRIVLVARANVAECLVALGQKETGRSIIAKCLEQLKSADGGGDASKLAWTATEVKRLTELLASLN